MPFGYGYHNTFALKAASAVQVRDRATLYLSQLTGSAEEAVQLQWDVPAKNLEASLRAYLQTGATQAFDLVRLSPPHGCTAYHKQCDKHTRLLHGAWISLAFDLCVQ